MKTRTKGVSVFGVALLCVIVGLAVLNFGQSTGTGPFAKLIVQAAGVADSYGNRIEQFWVLQNTTGTWTTITSINYATFTNGSTLSIPANQPTLLYWTVFINSTLASDNATALARTRVYLTINPGLTITQINGFTSLVDGVNREVYFSYPSRYPTATSVWTPATDTTYTVTLQYQAYY